MNILISGASGLIGSELVPFLATGGHNVIRLVRSKSGIRNDAIFWDPENGIIDHDRLNNIDAVIHLAGENIGTGLWTPKKKKEIIESRTRGTSLLAKKIANMDRKPSVFICASAIGYYGNRGDELLKETSYPGKDFLSEVCFEWEKSAQPAVEAGIRTVFARIGVVLSPQGGALERILLPFSIGLGGIIGNGKNYLSWISIDDLIAGIYYVLMDNKISGPVNMVSPGPVINKEFSKKVGKVLKRPVLFRVPPILIKLLFGHMGKETILSSTRVIPEKLLASDFEFRHSDLEQALKHLLGR